MLKYQQFENGKSDIIKPKISKRQHINKHDNEERNGLDEYEDEIKYIRYVPPPFIALSPLSQKESNRPLDLGKETKSLNHLVYIPKICYSEKC